MKQYCEPKDIYMDTLGIVPYRSKEKTSGFNLYWKEYPDQQSKRKTHRQLAERDRIDRMSLANDWL
eukprot:CAMPEP_0168568354 /NCGR_PEP_ID=MMETSP0413-20121227/15529_1 /TAXON_ID=136452 /ORGANISM="Filamoeba nolandi, Strain NC-AS-23-1" /LENGTH=65 /DNA_ID=CAMNT_0008600677 /DNA_START=131 /DNA_END=328 /DNA_ORIENTATION=-